MMYRVIGLEIARHKALSIHLCDFGYNLAAKLPSRKPEYQLERAVGPLVALYSLSNI